MKIILSAFNRKMRSEPMDVPDNIGLDFYMSMSLDVLSPNPHFSNLLDSNAVVLKRGHFRDDGHIWNLVKDLGMDIKYGDEVEARSYTLVDIS